MADTERDQQSRSQSPDCENLKGSPLQPAHAESGISSSLVSWLTNIAVGCIHPVNEHFMYYKAPIWYRERIKQAPLRREWKRLQDELGIPNAYDSNSRHYKVAVSFHFYANFMISVDSLIKKREKMGSKNYNSTLHTGISHLAVAVDIIQGEKPEYLRQCPSLLNFIQSLIFSSSFVFSAFGLGDWGKLISECLTQEDPVTVFHRNSQRPTHNAREDLSTLAGIWDHFTKDMKQMSGRFQDNRNFYQPTFIVDANGELVDNLGLTFVSREDENERRIPVDYMAAIEHLQKNPDDRPVIPESKMEPDDLHQRYRNEYYFQLAHEFRANNHMEPGNLYTIFPPSLSEIDACFSPAEDTTTAPMDSWSTISSSPPTEMFSTHSQDSVYQHEAFTTSFTSNPYSEYSEHTNYYDQNYQYWYPQA
ncbi:hypothetical protein H072_8905 [Dactylellina haptotyla CBS 200.50]|uniref:Uncharacterized protein n=1 Tax=Dactylellina haptotyla (strain CBS 200.50) TaxID=1284197 RepID=S8BDX1_DACHA|nr:hypothetical protein H072_8905 [Dactylellina haptotyla CBS 200.50]